MNQSTTTSALGVGRPDVFMQASRLYSVTEKLESACRTRTRSAGGSVAVAVTWIMGRDEVHGPPANNR